MDKYIDKLDGWPAWAVESVGNYSVVSVIHKFVNLERYGRNFKPVNVSILDHDREKYAESLGMFASMAGALGVMFMLAIFATSCITCCCCSSKGKGSSVGRLLSIVLLFVFIIVGILSHGIGFAGEQRMGKVLNNTCGTIEFAFNKITKLQEATEQIQKSSEDLQKQTLTTVQTNLDKTNTALNDLDPKLFPGVAENIGKFQDVYNKVDKQVEDATKTMNLQVKPAELTKVIKTLGDVDKNCDKANDAAKAVMLSTSAFLALLTLLFVCSIFASCCGVCCSILGWIQLCGLLTALCVFLPLLVGGGDFCLNARAIIDKEAPQNPILNYYLTCPADANIGEVLGQIQRHKRDLNVGEVLGKLKGKKDMPEIPGGLPTGLPGLDSGMINDLLANVDYYFELAKNHTAEFDAQIQVVLDEKLNCNRADIPETQKKPCEALRESINDIRKVLISNSTTPDEGKDTLQGHLTTIKDQVFTVLEEIDCKDITYRFYDSVTDVCTNVYLTMLYYAVNYLIAFISIGMLILLSACLF